MCKCVIDFRIKCIETQMENVGWGQGLNFFLFVFFELFCGSNHSLLDDELNILKIGSC